MSTTHYYRVRIYVGPVHVAHYAAEAQRAGLANVWGGTAHVYGTFAAPPCENETDRLVLRQRIGTLIYPAQAVAWRDVQLLSLNKPGA
jgi:hypothetical protein